MEKRKRWFAEYYLYFVLYSILGWLYEVFLEVVVYRWGFSNRGVLLGPWCVVYGTGALLLIFCLGPLQRRPVRLGRVNMTPVLVFIGVVVLTTVLELIASYIMQAITGLTNGRVNVGAGTLYALLERFEQDRLICLTRMELNRKYYQLTPQGDKVLREEYQRIRQQAADMEQVLREEETT